LKEREDIIDKCRECDKDRSIHNFTGCLYRVEQINLHIIVEGEKTGDGISYASHVKNLNPLKARATTFYDPVHNGLDKEAQCAWKEGEGSDWPSVYIQKPFMTL
jgi:hypothetical protein